MNAPPGAPSITYPHRALRTLSPRIAWMGEHHLSYEVRIAESRDPEAASVWRSGEVADTASSAAAQKLPPARDLYAFVRLRNAAGWGAWSKPALLRTPAEPVLRILNPTHAGRVRGTDVEVSWELEWPEAATAQTVKLDGRLAPAVGPQSRSTLLKGLAPGVHRVEVAATIAGRERKASATFYVHKLVQLSPSKLYVLSLSHLQRIDVGNAAAACDAFDTLHAVGVLQGVVNKKTPRLYIDYTNVDRFWLDRIRAEGSYLEHGEIVPLATIDEAIAIFAGDVKGLVVWDPEVPSTSNVASTIAGVESLLPVRYDTSPGSLYSRLTGAKGLKIVRNLVGKFTGAGNIPDSSRESTGSAKCDAYLWAKMRYLDTGRCNPRNVGYWCDGFWLRNPRDMSLDNVGLTNHDYVVARKGFFCDLNVWPDEAPRDDPGQRPGLDREVLQEILLSCHRQSGGAMIHFSGFTPWAIKYTNVGNAGGKHDAVPTEWETARIASSYNAYMDADAIGYVGMANASVYAHCRLPDRLVQNPPPTREDLESFGYLDAEGRVARYNFVYHYLGDYDSAAWMYHRLPEIWRHPLRGQVPSGWAFNPNLIERLPIAFDWFYETKSPLDYFIAGDSGAGYINPTELLPTRELSGLPSGAQAWMEHNVGYYRRLNYSITGFLINGFCGELTEKSNAMFAPFSGDGIMTQPHWMPKGKKQDHLQDGMVVARMQQDITAPIDVVVSAILKHGTPDTTRFLAFRSILVGPEWIKTVNDTIRAERPDCRFEPVDPYTYFYLLRHSIGGKNERRATYTFDTLPDVTARGKSVRVTVGLRNDGWDTWKREGPDAVTLRAGFDGIQAGIDVALPHDVEPGDGAVLVFDISTPASLRTHEFVLDLRHGPRGYFGQSGDMPWRKTVEVR